MSSAHANDFSPGYNCWGFSLSWLALSISPMPFDCRMAISAARFSTTPAAWRCSSQFPCLIA